MAGPSRIVLLGPQRLRPTLRSAVEDLGVAGTLACVTAGWEEREAEDVEMGEHVGRPLANLALHARAEDAFRRDPALLTALRARTDRLRELRDLYRLRLDHALAAARELGQREGDEDLIGAELEAALEAVRALDAGLVERTRAIQEAFEAEARPFERERVAHHRGEIARLLDRCELLCVAGGHVAVLANRLRLFGVLELWGERPVVAWSAGAMALGQRMVLFHDSPPQGPGNAEVLEGGLGAFDGVIPLPHARRRLRLDDPLRVSILARRFAPDRCVALDEGARLELDGSSWTLAPDTRVLEPDGEVRAAALAEGRA